MECLSNKITEHHTGMVHKEQQALSITAQEDQELSKEQKAFNRLTKRIEKLGKEMEQEQERLDRINEHYRKSLLPIDEEIGRQKLDMAILLHDSVAKFKYGRNQKETIKNVILFLFHGAFEKIMPNENEEAIYDYWADISYKEELKVTKDEMKSDMSEELKFKYGVDIGLADFEDTPEGYAKFQEKLQEELDRKREEAIRFANKKKTKKQIEREVLQKEKEAMLLKSIRSIYISLAKVLHPDTNNDLENSRKEELMKKVTKAYAEKDLPTLLKLEMEWAASEQNNINTLSDSRLKLYIASLKGRVKELEAEKYAMYSHPKYRYITRWIFLSQKYAIRSINKIKKELREMVNFQKLDYANLKFNQTKKGILDFAEGVEEYAGLRANLDEEMMNAFMEMFDEQR